MKVAKTFLPVDDFMQDTAVSKSADNQIVFHFTKEVGDGK